MVSNRLVLRYRLLIETIYSTVFLENSRLFLSSIVRAVQLTRATAIAFRPTIKASGFQA